jgi:hypothetical protein
MQGQTSLTTGASNDNILSGQPFEFLPFDALVSFGITQATGNVGDLIVDVFSGADLLVSSFKPPVGAIDLSAHLYLEDEAMAGDRLVIKVRNTSGGTLALNWLVRIESL